MSAWLLAPLFFVALTAGGAGWLALLGHRCRCGPEWMGLSFAAGAAWMAIVAALLSPIAGAASGPLVLGLTALPMAARFRRAGGDARELRAGWLGFLPALAIVLLSLWLAAQRPVWNVDAQKRWALHGQWTAEYGTVLPERMREEAWSSSHPRYPPLLSAYLGSALDLGADKDTGLRPLMPAFFAALLGVLYGHVWGRRRKWAGIVTLAFALTPCFAYLPEHGSAIGLGADAVLADVTVALFATAAAGLILEALTDDRRSAWPVAAVMAAGAALTKQEGTALLFVLCAFTAGSLLLRRERLAGLARPALALVGAAGGWLLLSRSMPVEPGEDYLSAGALGDLVGQFERLPVVLARFAGESAAVAAWGLLWLLPLAGIALLAARWLKLARSPAPRGLGLLLLWLLGASTMVVAAYMATGWQGGRYEALMDLSLTRLLMHHAPLAALVAAYLGARDAPEAALSPARPSAR